jgi:hypothetical protein
MLRAVRRLLCSVCADVTTCDIDTVELSYLIDIDLWEN